LRSLAANEPLAGTASTIRRWLLVSHDGPWGRDGLLDARLPDGVGQALRDLGRRAGWRVLLIRRNAKNAVLESGGRVACFAVDTRHAWLGRRDLDRIEDAAGLDPRNRRSFGDPGSSSLFVICTHGRRDPCCAERGRPLAGAVAVAEPHATWESTHVGGDRFAGNLIAFPHGLTFGRVEPEEAAGLVRAHTEGRIAPLDRYRGRSRDPVDVQAAEAALRTELGVDGIDDLRLQDRAHDGERSEVTFASPAGAHRVRLEHVPGPPMRLTCHGALEEVPLIWRAVDVVAVG
jgi:hypothetical protein